MSIEFLTTILIVFVEWIIYMLIYTQKANIKKLFFIFAFPIGYIIIHYYLFNNLIFPKLFLNILLVALMFTNTNIQFNRIGNHSIVNLILLTFISFNFYRQPLSISAKDNLQLVNLLLEYAILILFFTKMKMLVNNIGKRRIDNDINSAMILFIGLYTYNSQPLIFLDSYTSLCFKNTGIYVSLISGIVASSMINMFFKHYNKRNSIPINKLNKYFVFNSNIFLLEYYIQVLYSIFFPILFIITIGIISSTFSGLYGMLIAYLSLVTFNVGDKYFVQNKEPLKIVKILYIFKILIIISMLILFLGVYINAYDGFLVTTYISDENNFFAIFGLTLSYAFFSMFISLLSNFYKNLIIQKNAHKKAYKLFNKKKFIFVIVMSFTSIILMFFSSIINKFLFKYMVLGFTLNSIIVTVYLINLKNMCDTVVLKIKNNISLYNKNKFDIQQQYRTGIIIKGMVSKLSFNVNMFFIELTGLVTVLFIIFIAIATKVDYILMLNG